MQWLNSFNIYVQEDEEGDGAANVFDDDESESPDGSVVEAVKEGRPLVKVKSEDNIIAVEYFGVLA